MSETLNTLCDQNGYALSLSYDAVSEQVDFVDATSTIDCVWPAHPWAPSRFWISITAGRFWRYYFPANDMPPITSTLRHNPHNPRYFTDDTGKAIYLTGSHTWANLQEIGLEGGPAFPFDEYMDFMQTHNHNFMRLWMFEHPKFASWTPLPITFDPLPWARTGPGLAADGKPKFNLDVWDDAYFTRLRERTAEAGRRGIYCAIMLFQGWSLHKTSATYGDPWPYHPFNAANNVNNIDVPFKQVDDDDHPCLHSTLNADVLAKQEAYVRKVIETVNDLDNVLYEIINEGGATQWQYHMIDFIHEAEWNMPKQHPIGMTHRISPKQFNSELFDSNADWISPAKEPQDWLYTGTTVLEDYQNDPPAADGRKVIINDTDHLWGHGGNYKWAWKTFLRGQNAIFMDPWWPLYLESTPDITPWTFTGGITKDQRDYPDWAPLRKAMGDTLRFAQKMDLNTMTPQPARSSSRYCLASADELLVYLPEGGPVTLNLRDMQGEFAAEWFFPQLGTTFAGASTFAGDDYIATVAPFTGDAVLYLKRRD